MSVKSLSTRTHSTYVSSWPGVHGATRVVTPTTRSNEKPGKRQRVRYWMAWRGLPCSLCGLSGSRTVHERHPAFLTFGHVIGLSLYGASGIQNTTPQHRACNEAAKRTPDLRGLVEYRVDTLPTQQEADDWAADGCHGQSELTEDECPTENAMRQARAGRGLTF